MPPSTCSFSIVHKSELGTPLLLKFHFLIAAPFIQVRLIMLAVAVAFKFSESISFPRPALVQAGGYASVFRESGVQSLRASVAWKTLGQSRLAALA